MSKATSATVSDAVRAGVDVFEDAPELPDFIARQFPQRRRALRLTRGDDAGRRMVFVDHGETTARPVLMIHGNPTWSFLWRKVIDALGRRSDDSGGFRAIAPDLLGLGASDPLPAMADHAVARHAATVVELVERLDLRDLVLVGQDWGGPIATVAAASMPERVSAAVFGNTAVCLPKHPRGTAFHRFARLPLVSDLVFRGLNFPQNILHRIQGDRSSIRGDVARAYRWPLRRWSDRGTPLALARMVPDGPDHPSMPPMRRGERWLTEGDFPVALVWGEKDPILGFALRRHRRALPRAEVTTTQAGHFLQEEVPEALADAIEAVARRVSPTG